MDTLVTVISAILVFGFLILIHELGHFISARIFKVKINEFSIGMGPKLLWHDSKKSGTRYAISALPIGGYVSMEGEDGDSENEGAFCSKPVWQRMIIIVAGAFMNILLGFIIMTVIVLTTKSYASNVIDVFVKSVGHKYLNHPNRKHRKKSKNSKTDYQLHKHRDRASSVFFDPSLTPQIYIPPLLKSQ